MRSSRNKWIHGYRSHATYAPGQFSPWSSCRLGLVTVGELDLDVLFRYFSRLKQYLFPIPEPRARPPIESQWCPRLVTSVQIATLYSQRPWDILDRLIAPVAFRPTGRFQALVTA